MKRTVTMLLLTAACLSTAAAAFPRTSYHAPKVSAPKTYKAPKSSPSLHSGYVTKSGTYVAPHYQTAPNTAKTDNWSSKPNVNPYTGRPGTKDPYATGH